MNQKLKLVVILIGIFMSILIGGCVEEPRQKGNSVNTSSSTLFFPVQKNPTDECLDAKLSDKPQELIIDGDGCLRASGYLLVWRMGFH